MSSPFKTKAVLISSKCLSPRISSFSLSPRQNIVLPSSKLEYQQLTPQKVQNTTTFNTTTLTNSKSCIKESFLLDTPHKKSLLNYGLSKHELLYLIGRGSFGTVIKSKYKGKIAAVKLLKKPSDVINERNALHLDQKNIVKVIDVIVSEKYSLVIMEYEENSKTLQQVLDEGSTLNEKTVIKYSIDVANGLKYCHINDVLHLDIKPQNILLCNNNICKICDFGNSFSLNQSNENFKYQGTVPYTAPELLKGLKPTPKCDIYSLGVFMCQLFTGDNPYKNLDSEVVIYRVVKFDLRPSLKAKNNKFIKLCQICWNRDPALRPTAEEVFRMLTTV